MNAIARLLRPVLKTVKNHALLSVVTAGSLLLVVVTSVPVLGKLFTSTDNAVHVKTLGNSSPPAVPSGFLPAPGFVPSTTTTAPGSRATTTSVMPGAAEPIASPLTVPYPTDFAARCRASRPSSSQVTLDVKISSIVYGFSNVCFYAAAGRPLSITLTNNAVNDSTGLPYVLQIDRCPTCCIWGGCSAVHRYPD